MTEHELNKIHTERNRELAETRTHIVNLPAEKALKAILDYRQPAALVQSFPEEDFYFLVHDIGLEDSLELMSLASFKQWDYFFDLEIWERDRIGLGAVTHWLDLFMKSDPNRFLYWFLNHKTDFVEYYLMRNVEVVIREHDQDPGDIGTDFHTVDDVFYLRYIDASVGTLPQEKERRDLFISEFLRHLAAYDHGIYQHVLLEMSGIIPAEAEEEAYRLRNVRLAEKGFVPAEEAIGVYQPLASGDLDRLGRKIIWKDKAETLPVPLYPIRMLKGDDVFTRSLMTLDEGDVLDQIRTEFAGLCNRVIAAERKPVRERTQLADVVKKVCGYLSIGLESLEEKSGKPDIAGTAVSILKYPLTGIFRTGYGRVVELKKRAANWRETSWHKSANLPLGFWDEHGMGVLGGLFLDKPLFFDNYKTGVLYRDFTTTDDIETTEGALNEIVSFDALLLKMNLPFGKLVSLKKNPDVFLTYKNLILSLWAANTADLGDDDLPMEIDRFESFFHNLWNEGEKPRKIRTSAKESFVEWLSGQTDTDNFDISREFGHAFERLFREIEIEYGEVDCKDLDPKHIHLFLLKS